MSDLIRIFSKHRQEIKELIGEFLRDWRWGKALFNHTFKPKPFICDCPHYKIYFEWFEKKWEAKKNEQ